MTVDNHSSMICENPMILLYHLRFFVLFIPYKFIGGKLVGDLTISMV